jgi:hypothetical protein
MEERPAKRARQWYEAAPADAAAAAPADADAAAAAAAAAAAPPDAAAAAAAAAPPDAAAAAAAAAPPDAAAAAAAAPPRRDRAPIHLLAVSDTHDLTLPDFLEQLPTTVPRDGGHRAGEHRIDALVHTGDFETASDAGGRYDRGINNWFGRQSGIPHRLLVCGNHDHTHGITKKPLVADQPTDANGRPNYKPGAVRGHCTEKYDDDVIYSGRRGFRPVDEAEADSSAFQRALGVPEQCIIHHAIYLQDNGVEVCGWKIFGTPWHGLHPGHILHRQALNYDSSCFE